MEHVPTFPLPPVSLVLGGARSGKSTHAEKLATGTMFGGTPRPALYIATAEAGDMEMATRITAHRTRRGANWTTIEAPLRLDEALLAHGEAGRPVLVDCLTLWLSNLMHAGVDLDEAADDLVHALAGYVSPVIFVSNEVGLGIVPETPLGRAFFAVSAKRPCRPFSRSSSASATSRFGETSTSSDTAPVGDRRRFGSTRRARSISKRWPSCTGRGAPASKTRWRAGGDRRLAMRGSFWGSGRCSSSPGSTGSRP